MGPNIITNLSTCIPSALDMLGGSFSLLYYSHIPIIVLSLFLGLFVMVKSKVSLLSRVFFMITLAFSAWAVLNLFTWLSSDTRVIMFAWSMTGLCEALFFVFSLYFVYLFIAKKDAPFLVKTLFALGLLSYATLLPTTYDLTAFNIDDCYALENNFALYYRYAIDVVALLTIIIYSVVAAIKADKLFRKQIVLLSTGVVMFLLSFFSSVCLSAYLAEKGVLQGYGFEIYGLFGMVFFLGLLAYMIVRFKVFNVKLLLAQALVVTMSVLIAAQFLFIKTPINRVLTGITLSLVVFFGWWLARSVKKEIEQREKLEKITAELKVANLRLQELDKQKTEFLSIAAHQLRTPLSIINGYVELIEDGAYGKVSKDLRAILENIDQSNGHLIKLVNDFLDISRLEQGRTKYCFAEGNLTELVDGIAKELSLKAEDKKLKLEYHPGAKAIKLVMDEEKIRHAAYNFTDNALKYTPEGTVKVKIVLEDGGVAFRVQDTGMGFDKVDQANFFQKFYRGSNTKDTGIDGTGLGLFVCAKFIEAHGGRVWAKSPGIGKGSEFGFWLPFTNKPSVCAPLAEIKK